MAPTDSDCRNPEPMHVSNPRHPSILPLLWSSRVFKNKSSWDVWLWLWLWLFHVKPDGIQLTKHLVVGLIRLAVLQESGIWHLRIHGGIHMQVGPIKSRYINYLGVAISTQHTTQANLLARQTSADDLIHFHSFLTFMLGTGGRKGSSHQLLHFIISLSVPSENKRGRSTDIKLLSQL